MKIGKKYKSYYSTVYECVGISPAGGAIAVYEGQEFLIAKSQFYLYTEVEEKVWINLYRHYKVYPGVGCYKTKKYAEDAVNNAVGSSQNWLGAVEVTVPSK
jgi:hypothetical protein